MNELQDPIKERGHGRGRLARLVRWLLCWRTLRRGLFVAACLATLIGLFYAVEDWRGKRAWEECRQELEAKGEVLDWNAYIPRPVPDDQNIFKAPRMADWFVRGPMLENVPFILAKPRTAQESLTPLPGREPTIDSAPVAEVQVVTPSSPRRPETADAVLRFDDPAAREQAEALLATAIGPCVEGPIGCPVLARPLDQIKPARWVVEAEVAPSLKALREFFLHSPPPQSTAASPAWKYLEIAPAGSNEFRVYLNRRVYSAADYLAWTQPQTADFDLMRKALERPLARIDGDYEEPFGRPMMDFVMFRTVAQRLAQRAQCYLLLGQPESAQHELALVRGICRMMEAKSAGDNPMLVQVMIDVAIGGLYVFILQDCSRLQAWREPELAAIQKQLGEVNYLPGLYRSLQTERAASCRTFEITPPAQLAEIFSFGQEKQSLWKKLGDPVFLLLAFAPRGWVYQNMCAGACQMPLLLGGLDITNNRVQPRTIDDAGNQMRARLSHFAPYTFLVRNALPNFTKATRTTVRTQTQVNEAFIACGLERYRLAHGQYPENLEALVPQFAGKIPHDIIGGQPLKYRRTKDGRFVLYSVGWNETDDGGVPGKTDLEGDSVWQ